MMDESDVIFLVQEAQEKRDPTILQQLVQFLSTREGAVELRHQLREVVIQQHNYESWLGWIDHSDPSIAKTAAAIVLSLRDIDLCIEIFTKLTEMDIASVPFQVRYDFAEREFNIGLVDFPALPGWGVSHYGRDNPRTDRLLRTLERFYGKVHQGETPPYFRN